MPGRPARGAANAVTATVTDYGPDARGGAMFVALSAMAQRGMSGHTGTVYAGARGAPEASFNGDLGRNLQGFTGAAALALYGTAKPGTTIGANDLSSAVSQDSLDNEPMRIFAARARRQSML